MKILMLSLLGIVTVVGAAAAHTLNIIFHSIPKTR